MPRRATSVAGSTTDQHERPGGGGLYASATTAASLRASNVFGAWDVGPRSRLPQDRAADSCARPAGPPAESSRLRPPRPASPTPCRVARGSESTATAGSTGASGRPSSPPAPPLFRADENHSRCRAGARRCRGPPTEPDHVHVRVHHPDHTSTAGSRFIPLWPIGSRSPNPGG
jgi:hypothetical protein